MPEDRRQPRRAVLAGTLAGALAMVALAVIPVSSRGDLTSSYNAHQQQAKQLQSTIGAESGRIDSYRGTISSLEQRLSAIQRSVDVQRHLLVQVRSELVAARQRLQTLKAQFARDQKVLAAQLLADYESPPPTIVNVVVDAHGFDDLLNRVNNLHAIEQQNERTTTLVRSQRREVASQTQRLAVIEARRQRATAAVVVERDQVAQLRLSIVSRELVVARARAANTSRLTALRKKIAGEAATLNRQAAAAQSLPSGGVPASAGCASPPFTAHGGSFGFFQAAGTDYSVGEEPTLAARLDALGKALQLHLEGISGYRTPQHSVEVGGFADDPHTQGRASDTPGVEGVPEASLERFCLTRPFGGAAEADHIQLLGG